MGEHRDPKTDKPMVVMRDNRGEAPFDLIQVDLLELMKIDGDWEKV